MRFIKTFLAICTVSAALTAAPVFTPDPDAAVLNATPGSIVGWGFMVAPDPDEWISFISSFLISDSDPTGTYTDFIGGLGGPVGAYLPPASGNWQVPLDLAASLGLGAYTVDPTAAPGTTADLTVRVLYERYSDDPNTCDSCYIDTSDLDVNLSLQVVQPDGAATPEPSSYALMAAGGALLLWRRTRAK